jgi:alpha-tubulin suppressor-like RCC1 family protein
MKSFFSFSVVFFIFLSNLKSQCFKQMDSGDQYVGIGVKEDGTLWGWGDNSDKQLGIGNMVGPFLSPIQLGTGNYWKQVVSATIATLAIKTDGTLWSCGSNLYGILGIGSFVNKSTYTKVGTSNDWQMLAANYAYCAGLKKDSSIWTWGYNIYGQLGNGTILNNNKPTPINDASKNWKTMTCAQTRMFAIKYDSTLWAWGSNGYYGGLGIGSTINQNSPVQVGINHDWLQVSAGLYFTIALKANGTIWAWGLNDYGVLGSGPDSFVPIQIGTDSDWKQVMAGARHSMAIKNDGSLWTWGDNTYGQLGNGSFDSEFEPVQIDNTTDWADILTASDCVYVQKKDGSIWAWGDNEFQILGIGVVGAHVSIPVLFNCENGPLAVSDDSKTNNLVQAFPNPATDKIFLEIKNLTEPTQQAEIINTTGKIVLQKQDFDIKTGINIENLPVGIYFLKITDGNQQFSTRFVKL